MTKKKAKKAAGSNTKRTTKKKAKGKVAKKSTRKNKTSKKKIGKRKAGKRPSSRGVSGGPKLVRSRHAPDGSIVPLGDERAGRTFSEEWVVTDGDFGGFELISGIDSWQEFYETMNQAWHFDDAIQFEEIEIWAHDVLVDHGYEQHSGESFSVGGKEIEPPWALPTQGIPRHSQLMQAALAKRACELLRYAVHKGDITTTAKWSAYAVECYMTARFKREEESDVLIGGKIRDGGKQSSKKASPLQQGVRQEARRCWQRKPKASGRQMARLVRGSDRKFGAVREHTIRGWIADLNPARKR